MQKLLQIISPTTRSKGKILKKSYPEIKIHLVESWQHLFTILKVLTSAIHKSKKLLMNLKKNLSVYTAINSSTTFKVSEMHNKYIG